jgi:hypothetical protein
MLINRSDDTMNSESDFTVRKTEIENKSQQDNDEETSGLTCWSKFRFFLKQTTKDIWRHKCQFCLSFCSVFVVVLSILVVVSITKKGPIIFLRLSEKTVGEYDGIYSSSHENVSNLNEWIDNGYYLNYTQVRGVTDGQYNLSPRMQFCGT